MYKLLVEMTDRISQRRQAVNSFYLAVNTAIIGGAAFTAHFSRLDSGAWAISLAGILICILWVQAIRTYADLNSAKFQVITQLETRLAATPFDDEWQILTKNDCGKKYKPFHKTEVFVPVVFALVHGAQLVSSFVTI